MGGPESLIPATSSFAGALAAMLPSRRQTAAYLQNAATCRAHYAAHPHHTYSVDDAREWLLAARRCYSPLPR